MPNWALPRPRITKLIAQGRRWYEGNGQLTDAVRHATRVGDWPLAAGIVIDGLAIGEIIEPRGSPPLGEEFKVMPHGQAWTEPQLHLVSGVYVSSVARTWPISPPSSIPITRRRRSPQRGKAKQKRSDLCLADLGLVVTRDGGIPLTWRLAVTTIARALPRRPTPSIPPATSTSNT